MKKIIAFFLIIVLTIIFFYKLNEKKNYIFIDDINLFNKTETSSINTKLYKLSSNKTVVFGIFIIEQIEDKFLNTNEFVISKINEYNLVKKGLNNTIILVIETKERKITIDIGYGVEWIISDNDSEIILDNIIPYFKNNDIFGGIQNYLSMIDSYLHQYNFDIKSNDSYLTNKNHIIGEIVEINYSKKDIIFPDKIVYPQESDNQYNEKYQMLLKIGNNEVVLYYTKHMYKLINIMVSNDTELKLIGRIINKEPYQIQLMGIKS